MFCPQRHFVEQVVFHNKLPPWMVRENFFCLSSSVSVVINLIFSGNWLKYWKGEIVDVSFCNVFFDFEEKIYYVQYLTWKV